MNQPHFNSRSRDHAIPLNRDDYAIIGRELVERNLPLAKEIIQDRIISSRLCTEWDVSQIPTFYKPGMDRRLFVGIILQLYHPHDLNKPKFLFRKRLPFHISQTLNMKSGNTATLMKEVLVRLRVYDDFRNQVQTEADLCRRK